MRVGRELSKLFGNFVFSGMKEDTTLLDAVRLLVSPTHQDDEVTASLHAFIRCLSWTMFMVLVGVFLRWLSVKFVVFRNAAFDTNIVTTKSRDCKVSSTDSTLSINAVTAYYMHPSLLHSMSSTPSIVTVVMPMAMLFVCVCVLVLILVHL